MAPVLRSMAWLAAACTDLAGVEAVVWQAARRWSNPRDFRKGIESWIANGDFPGLLLTSLAPAPDGGLHSEGLALFVGQDLRIEPDLAKDLDAATRLALRLFDYLGERGKIVKTERVAGPAGERLELSPSAN